MAGAEGLLSGVSAFLALTWIGFFATLGGAILFAFSMDPARWLALSSLELLYLTPALLATPLLTAYLVRTSVGPLVARIAMAFVAALALCGAFQSMLIMGGIPLPALGAMLVSFYIIYFSVSAALLYLMVWSVRVVGVLISRLMLGPDRDIALLNLELGLVGAAIAAGLATAIAIFGGANPWLVDRDWFYVMAVPALIGFGVSTPRPRRPSILFALAVAVLAAGVGWAAIPVRGERHAVHCNPFYSGGEHSVFYRAEEPWRWERPSSLREWLFTPVILAELTFWHVVDPVTEADCPTP